MVNAPITNILIFWSAFRFMNFLLFSTLNNSSSFENSKSKTENDYKIYNYK